MNDILSQHGKFEFDPRVFKYATILGPQKIKKEDMVSSPYLLVTLFHT